MTLRLLFALLPLLVLADAASAQTPPGPTRPVPKNLLQPLPSRGAVPPIVARPAEGTPDLRIRADLRRYRAQLRGIRHEFFRSKRSAAKRAEGLEQLREFTDPAAFTVMVTEMARESDDIRRAVLDHLASRGDDGQVALAWTAIHADDPVLRNEATRRMTTPASPAVLRQLDESLRSRTHAEANNAGALAGALNALETIPLLIFAQATEDPVDEPRGDLAWIAIQTQRAYVANLQPIVGENAGAFQPILGIVNEGIVLRVTDAFAIAYRTEIHTALLDMTQYLWGQPTDHLGYDMPAWWQWYNTELVPVLQERARLAELGWPDDG